MARKQKYKPKPKRKSKLKGNIMPIVIVIVLISAAAVLSMYLTSGNLYDGLPTDLADLGTYEVLVNDGGGGLITINADDVVDSDQNPGGIIVRFIPTTADGFLVPGDTNCIMVDLDGTIHLSEYSGTWVVDSNGVPIYLEWAFADVSNLPPDKYGFFFVYDDSAMSIYGSTSKFYLIGGVGAYPEATISEPVDETVVVNNMITVSWTVSHFFPTTWEVFVDDVSIDSGTIGDGQTIGDISEVVTLLYTPDTVEVVHVFKLVTTTYGVLNSNVVLVTVVSVNNTITTTTTSTSTTTTNISTTTYYSGFVLNDDTMIIVIVAIAAVTLIVVVSVITMSGNKGRR